MMWRRHRQQHTPRVPRGTEQPMGMGVRFGEATQSLVDWMVRHAAADTLTVDATAWEYVTDNGSHCALADWMVHQGIPEGWLRLQAGKDVGQVLFDAWADGLMRIHDTELALLERIALRLQTLTDSGIPWGAAAAHVLLMLAEVTSEGPVR